MPGKIRTAKNWNCLWLGLIALSAFDAGAAGYSRSGDYKEISYTIEPIIGYTFTKNDNPPRTTGTLTYGARVIAGWKIISAEAEYTEGKSEEAISSPLEEIDEKSQRLRLGLRSTYSVGSMLDWFLRGGAEAQKHLIVTTTTGGSSSTDDGAWNVYPYVGTGVSVFLGSYFALNAGVTATLKDLHDFKKTEYETALGVSVGFNGK